MTDQSNLARNEIQLYHMKLNLCPSSQPVDLETAVRRATGIRTSTVWICIAPTSASPTVLLACVLLRELDDLELEGSH
ncbi:hypothetical protein FB451DRAFT_1549163 [Mycena latifolia]|nr:hypothetical protein FB451DRAFT_1549163 [Mycena latifolia]